MVEELASQSEDAMAKRDRRESDNWKSKVYHLQFGKLTVTILSTGWGVIGAGVTGIGDG